MVARQTQETVALVRVRVPIQRLHRLCSPCGLFSGRRGSTRPSPLDQSGGPTIGGRIGFTVLSCLSNRIRRSVANLGGIAPRQHEQSCLPRREMMSDKAVVSLTTGLEDPEKVTVALLVAVAAAEEGRAAMMFLTKEAVRLATDGTATGSACEGCPALPTLMERYVAAGGRFLVCPICFGARGLD